MDWWKELVISQPARRAFVVYLLYLVVLVLHALG